MILAELMAQCDYSRKPGFTETRLRPLARRREITARPLLVFMRERNPCVFERRRRLGWNVRFGITELRSSLAKSYLGQSQSISVGPPAPQLAASRGPRQAPRAHLRRIRYPTSSHAAFHFWCRVRIVVQFAPRAQQQIFFLPVTFTKSITRNACRDAQRHLGLPLWIFHARMPCSHRENISRSLS